MRETLLWLHTLPDSEKKKHITHLLSSDQQLINKLIPILQQDDEDMLYPVLSILKEMQYPDNSLALPWLLHARAILLPLLKALVQASFPLQIAIIQTLAYFGPQILPDIIALAETDDDLIETSFDIAGGVTRFFTKNGYPDLYDQLINTLADTIDLSMPALIYTLNHLLKEWWEVSITVLQKVGYPANQAALPGIIDHAIAHDLNHPDWTLALELVNSLAPTLIAPYLIQMLSTCVQQQEWSYVLDICFTFQYFTQQEEMVHLCTPILTFVLEQVATIQDPLAPHILSTIRSLLHIEKPISSN